jgi:hypothetical protein
MVDSGHYKEHGTPAEDQERRRWRNEFVDSFLAECGLARDDLAAPTIKNLDDWARQTSHVENQPSANFNSVVVELCKACESQLASGLGKIEGLTFLAAESALGTKADTLGKTPIDEPTKQRLKSRGIMPGFVKKDLPGLMKRLADLRSESGSAHGGAILRSATMKDAEKARGIAKDILRRIAVPLKGQE